MSDALERVYERRLLGMARREANATNRWITVYPQCPDGSWYVEAATGIQDDTTPSGEGGGPNLADALAALLRDLNVEDVPERVSVEEVREAAEEIVVAAANVFPRNALGSVPFALERLRMLYASGNRGALLAASILAVG